MWDPKTPTPTLSDLLVGFSAGLAMCADYAAAPAAASLVAFWALPRRPQRRSFGLALLGSALPLGLLAHFHAAAFGSVLSTSYSHLENPAFAQDIAPGLLGISAPSLTHWAASLFAPYLGLFFWSPWTALAPLAAPLFLRESRVRAAGLCACAVVAYYLLFPAVHSLWRSGWTVGPRYLTPIVPFAAASVGLAVAHLRGPGLGAALGLLGGAGAAAIVATGLASAVCQGFPLEPYNPLVEVVAPLLAHGYVPRNLLQLAGVPGLWSALPTFFALGAGATLALTAALRVELSRRHRAVASLLAASLGAAVILLQWSARTGVSPRNAVAVRFLASVWEPDPPPGARPFR